MKKYTKLFAFSLFSIAFLSVYCISQVVAKPGNIDLVFTTFEGDDTYLEPLVLTGFASSNPNETDPRFTYKDGQFSYQKQQSLLKNIDRVNNPRIDSLRENYRSFVRGKSPFSYYNETEDLVIYTNTNYETYWQSNDYSIEVSILNKNDESVSEHTLKLPEDESNIFTLESVSINYPNIYYLINRSEELKLYSTNLTDNNPTLTLEQNFTDQLGPNTTSYSMFNSNDANDIFLELGTLVATGSYSSYETQLSHLYNYDTGDILEIDTIQNEDTLNTVFNEDDIYLYGETEDYFTLQQVTFEGGGSKDTIEFEKQRLPQRKNSEEDDLYYDTIGIRDGILYTSISDYQENLSRQGIQVNDIQTGELLYFGMIEPNDVDVWSSNYYLTD
ncbi:hypothetical protein ACFP65_06745 [Marinilactibacillus sp. GCM10026970]|uniref:hypothetical protein n=1 Tax=Marinilactibacillus sp. GCM10026970 TaxID=3252642 RepID=UPI0036091031